jgi:hypothetical protein
MAAAPTPTKASTPPARETKPNDSTVEGRKDAKRQGLLHQERRRRNDARHGQNGPFGVAVDSSHLHWTNQGDGTVDDAHLDGTGVTTLVTGQNGPAGVTVTQQ